MENISSALPEQRSPVVCFCERYRVHLGQAAFYLMLYYFFFYSPIRITEVGQPQYIAAVASLIIGVFIRSAAAGSIKKNRQLSTSGIYSIARHPLYIGSFFIFAGMNMLINNIMILAITTVLFFMTHLSAIRREEQSLSLAFSDEWENYARSTRALLPHISRIGNVFKTNWSFDQWKKNREYNASLAVIVIAALLYGYAM